MSLKIGIVGLPNVGKSTLFNALVKSSVAEANNYPFCTIEPNVGIVDIPDGKLPKLAEVARSAQIVPAAVEFVDIAGLVAGASHGEGLGNKFLSHIREVDAIILVVRAFRDANVINTQADVNPSRDAHLIDLELMLADLETVIKRQETIGRDVRAGKDDARMLAAAMEVARAELEAERPLRDYSWDEGQLAALRSLSLLSLKPLMVLVNVDEGEANLSPAKARETYFSSTNLLVIPVSAKIEAEISQLAPTETTEFLESIGLTESGLDRVSREAYHLLGLQSYYTAGEKEARAWTVKQGATAPQAAGVIHGDFERGFIAAEVAHYADFITLGGWAGCRTAGKVRTEGKTYVMQPDDVVLFRFNV